MSNAKHTPGPWGYDIETGEVYAKDGEVSPLIATIEFDNCISNQQANADGHLIAAAPDQNKALIEAEEWIFNHVPDCAGREYHLSNIRAAIAKARGQA